jgi:hypothetical protein
MNSRLGLLILTFFAIVSTSRAVNYEYRWTGGSAGFTGSIILDSNSSDGGTLANIVSAEVTLINTCDLHPMAAVFLETSFTWTPTEITKMNIHWFTWGSSVTTGASVYTNGFNVLGSGFSGYDVRGSWLAVPSSVPEMGSTALLLALGLLSFGAIRKPMIR